SLVLLEPPAFSLLGVTLPPKPLELCRLLLRDPRAAIGFLKFGATGIRPAIKAFQGGDDEAGLRIFMRANLGSRAFDRVPPARLRQAFENARPLKAQLRAGFPRFTRHD